MSEDRRAEYRFAIEREHDQAYQMAQAIVDSKASVDVAVDPPTVVDIPALLINGVSDLTSCNVGDTLTVTNGNWVGEPTSYSQSWVSNSTEVGTGDTYIVQASDAGNSISCIVTATNAAGSTDVTTKAVLVSSS